jgi:dihydrodipicolinate synthase/N-acetylneuraminate lyase
MTNPNHTDISRSGDLVERLREVNMLIAIKVASDAADRIEALEARIAELEEVAGDLLTRFEPWSPHDHDADKRARAALGEKQ